MGGGGEVPDWSGSVAVGFFFPCFEISIV